MNSFLKEEKGEEEQNDKKVYFIINPYINTEKWNSDFE